MGFMDELRKLTQPYDDEDDFFEGADVQYKPQPQAQQQPQSVSREQALFESSFGGGDGGYSEAQPQRRPAAKSPKAAQAKPAGLGGIIKQQAQPQPQAAQNPDGSLFGNLGKPKQPKREGRVNFGGREAQICCIMVFPAIKSLVFARSTPQLSQSSSAMRFICAFTVPHRMSRPFSFSMVYCVLEMTSAP